jgi:hypothetical protein
MHTYPGPDYPYTFKWSMEYRNVQFSRLAQRLNADRVDPDRMELQWNTVPYMNYRVWTSGNLQTWGALPDCIPGDGHSITYTNAVDACSSRYYHLRVQ